MLTTNMVNTVTRILTLSEPNCLKDKSNCLPLRVINDSLSCHRCRWDCRTHETLSENLTGKIVDGKTMQAS
jgi:hypothetical protein